MPDYSLTRAILKTFGNHDLDANCITTDRMQLLAPSVHEYDSDSVWDETQRLVSVGVLVVGREIHMRGRGDVPTLRATDAGRELVWRAFDDALWKDAVNTLRALDSDQLQESNTDARP